MDGGDYDGGGGGGFVAGQSPGAGGGGQQGGKGGGFKLTDTSKAVLPMTVKQFDSASQHTASDPWVVDKVELSFGRIIGRILDLQDDHSTCRFLLHDGTGSIQFTHYVEHGEAWSLKRGSLDKGKYVDVVFEVKSNASKDCFPLSFSVVSDPNRITRHLLEVVYSHLYHTRGALAAPGGSGGMSSTSPSGAGHGGGGGGGGGLGMGGEGSREADLAGDQAAVLNIYKEAPEDEDGITLQEVITKGKQRGISEATVRAATMALQMEGHIYSTVDESHFRAT